MATAAVRFQIKDGRGPRQWFNPGDDVPEDIAAMVDERCLVGADQPDPADDEDQED